MRRNMTETLIDLVEHIEEQIKLYEDDLDMTTEEDMASFYQGQLEAYEDCLIKLKYILDMD
jgi:hypothetical protein